MPIRPSLPDNPRRELENPAAKQIPVTPRDKLVVITGLSGSGKSSLAFDTIYAEGQRKYVESLSAYARQFLDQMQKGSGVSGYRRGGWPSGHVSVCWDRLKEDGRLTFDLQIPVGVTARVHVPRLSAKADLVIDGGSVQPVEKTDRYLIVELGAGRHHGVL